MYLNGCCQELKIDILGTHPSAILMFFFLETSVKNILHLPFTKIIKATGNGKYCTFKAREESKLTVKKIATIALYRLFELILLALNVTFYVFFWGFLHRVCFCLPLPLFLFLFGWASNVICNWCFQSVPNDLLILSLVLSQICGWCLQVMVLRAVFACAFLLFVQAMYNNLVIDGRPVARGSSLLGFFWVGLAFIPLFPGECSPFLSSRSG